MLSVFQTPNLAISLALWAWEIQNLLVKGRGWNRATPGGYPTQETNCISPSPTITIGPAPSPLPNGSTGGWDTPQGQIQQVTPFCLPPTLFPQQFTTKKGEEKGEAGAPAQWRWNGNKGVGVWITCVSGSWPRISSWRMSSLLGAPPKPYAGQWGEYFHSLMHMDSVPYLHKMQMQIKGSAFSVYMNYWSSEVVAVKYNPKHLTDFIWIITVIHLFLFIYSPDF